MATNTPNLNLYKKDPTQDQNDTFNIDTMLNENWDKIDQSVEYLEGEIKSQVNQQTITLTNSNPTQHISAKQNCGVDIEVGGEMVVNLLGRNGDCEELSNWRDTRSSIELNSTNKVFGYNSIKVTTDTQTGYHYIRWLINKGDTSNDSSTPRIRDLGLSVGDYIMLSLYTMPHNGKSYVQLEFWDDSIVTGMGYNKSQYISDNTKFTRILCKTQIPSGADRLSVMAMLADSSDNRSFTGTTENASFDGITLHKISAKDYSLTDSELLVKYPYTNSIQPLLNPTVEVCGKNLMPGFLSGWYAEQDGVITSVTNDSITINNINSGGDGAFIKRTLKPNTTYMLSIGSGTCDDGDNFRIRVGIDDGETSSNGTYISAINAPNTSITLITPDKANLVFGIVQKPGSTATTITINNIQLEEGTTVTQYEPYKGGQIILPTELAKIDMHRDKITYKDGVVKVNKEIVHVLLDGNQEWITSYNKTGYKVVRTIINDGVASSQIISKYNGKILENMVWGSVTWGTGDIDKNSYEGINGTHRLDITILDADSGWGEDYDPLPEEIKAYFNGWYMCHNDGTPYTSGDKYWNKIYSGIGIPHAYPNGQTIVNGVFTTTVPTEINDMGYKPYQLYYVLQEPIQKEVQPIILGESVNLVEGQNTITIKSGYILEKVKPTLSNAYYIGYDEVVHESYSPLKFKSKKIHRIYREFIDEFESRKRVDDTLNWMEFSDINDNNAVYMPKEDFESTEREGSTYYILYEVLKEDYNCQIQEVEISYEDNIRGAINELVETTANNEKTISDLMEFILPIADKELSMSNVDLLTTATAEENKAKINELINIWKG